MMREFDLPTTSMSVGSTGWFGARPTNISPVAQVFSFYSRRGGDGHRVAGRHERGGALPCSAAPFDPSMVERPAVDEALPEAPDPVEVRLIDVAWARSGDKGDAFNVGVIARGPNCCPGSAPR
ncbi:AtuA-related protein [Sphingomonas sp. MMS24-JH45]